MSKLYLRYKESKIPLFFHGILCIAAYILWILLVILMLPLFILIQFIKFSNLMLTQLFCHGYPLCLNDIPFVLDCKANPYNVVGFFKINGHLDSKDLTDLVYSRILDKINDSPTLIKLKQYI
ncbi:hypothetical protein MXB_2948, partial [Myxobolus squamalis]